MACVVGVDALGHIGAQWLKESMGYYGAKRFMRGRIPMPENYVSLAESPFPDWYVRTQKERMGLLAEKVGLLKALKTMHECEQFRDRKAAQISGINMLTQDVLRVMDPKVDRQIKWLASVGAEPCSPPKGWYRGLLVRIAGANFYVGPMPPEVQTLARDAVARFGPRRVFIYSPEPSHFTAIPVPLAYKDPMLVVICDQTFYRLAIWGISHDLEAQQHD